MQERSKWIWQQTLLSIASGSRRSHGLKTVSTSAKLQMKPSHQPTPSLFARQRHISRCWLSRTVGAYRVIPNSDDDRAALWTPRLLAWVTSARSPGSVRTRPTATRSSPCGQRRLNHRRTKAGQTSILTSSLFLPTGMLGSALTIERRQTRATHLSSSWTWSLSSTTTMSSFAEKSMGPTSSHREPALSSQALASVNTRRTRPGGCTRCQKLFEHFKVSRSATKTVTFTS